MKETFGAKPVKSSMRSRCWTTGNRKSAQPIFGLGAKVDPARMMGDS
jgi:hypothetical protein